MSKCKTPGTIFSFAIHGNMLVYTVKLPEGKNIPKEIAKDLEQELHDYFEEKLDFSKICYSK